MAEKADLRQVTTVEELLRVVLYEQEALRVLVRKGLVQRGGAGRVKAVRREMEGKRGP